MVTNRPERNYIFLDSELEREQLIRNMGDVRDEVIKIVTDMPETGWYETRYHGWSPAATLAHLNMMDVLSLMHIKAALIGFRPKVSLHTIHRLNNFTARIFTRRIVGTTVKGIRKKQQAIADFILQLPIDKFSTPVYDPVLKKTLTIEQALQERFYFHWLDHLQTIREVEGIEQPPEERSDSV